MAEYSPFESLKPEYKSSVSETTNQKMIEKRKPRHGMDPLDATLLASSFVPGPMGAGASVLGTAKEYGDYFSGDRDDLTPLDLFLSTASIPLSLFSMGGLTKAARGAKAAEESLRGANKALEVAETTQEAKKALGEGLKFTNEAALKRGKEALSIGEEGADWDQIRKTIRNDLVEDMITNRPRGTGAMTDGMYQEMVRRADAIAEQEVKNLQKQSTTYNKAGNTIVTEEPLVYGSKYQDNIPTSPVLDQALTRTGLTPAGTKLTNKYNELDPSGLMEKYRMLAQGANAEQAAANAIRRKALAEIALGGALRGASNVDEDDVDSVRSYIEKR